jgi:hypothetical protein
VKTWRIVLGVLGLGAGLFGAIELFTGVPLPSLLRVAVWLAAAVIIHDAIWSPGLIGVGALLSRVPARARRYLQSGLVVAGALTVIAVPMIYLRGQQPPSKAILLQDVGANLALLIVIVAAVSAAAYGLRVIKDRGRPGAPSAPADSGSGAGPVDPKPATTG